MSKTKETVLSVDGMTCSSCVSHVEEALRELAGIDEVEVRLRDATVRIVQRDMSGATGATIDEMIGALGEAGYESRAAGS
jgi:copper chaperone